MRGRVAKILSLALLVGSVCAAADPAALTPRFTISAGESIQALAFSPVDDILAFATDESGGTLTVWDTRTARSRFELRDTRIREPITFSPTGELLACRSSNGGVLLWKVRTGELVGTLAADAGWSNSLAFSPDGKLLASASQDSKVRLWEVGTGRCVQTLGGLARGAQSVAFSPDGGLVAAGAWHQARIWEVGNWKSVQNVDVVGNYASPLVFSPDGRLFAIYDGAGGVRLYSVSRKRGGPLAYRTTIDVGREQVTSLAFSPDSATLAAGQNSRIALISVMQEAVAGVLLRGIPGPSAGWAISMAFSHDGTLLACAGWDNAVRVWDASAALAPLPPHEILAWEEFRHYASSLEDECDLQIRIINEQRTLTGVPWIDEALRQFSTGTCKTMEDISNAIADLSGQVVAGISYSSDLVKTGEQIVLENMKAAAAEAFGRPLSSSEESAIDSLYNSTVGRMVAGAADSLESEATERFTEFADKLDPKAVGEAAVGILRSNILDYIAAFKGALVGGKLGILPSLRAVGVSAFRDLAADLKGVNVYAIPLAIAFYLNDVTGTGKSSSMLLLGLNKLDEAKSLARICYGRAAKNYDYADICRLYQGYQLLRDACDLFYQSYAVLTPQVGAIPEKASFWESVLGLMDRNFLNPLGAAVCSAAKETRGTPIFDTLPIPTGWYLGYGAGCGIKTNH